MSKEIEYKINLMQMYVQTIEDFTKIGGSVKIIEKNKKDKIIENAIIPKEFEKYIIPSRNIIMIYDIDEQKTDFIDLDLVQNIRFDYYSSTLTITL